MNAIIGLTEMTLETSLDETQRGYLTTVLESAESLMGIINEILDLSKIEAGKLELECRPFRLRPTIEEIARPYRLKASARGLNFTVSIGENVPELLVGDAGKLRQILINLIGNALKFTQEGRILVDIGLIEILASHVRLRFSVIDSGIGIPGDRRDKIFQAFQQADSSITRRFGGTGLGLAIAGHLVHLMGGEITVDSEPGRGSRFEFSVDLKTSPDGNKTGPLPSSVPTAPVVLLAPVEARRPDWLESLRANQHSMYQVSTASELARIVESLGSELGQQDTIVVVLDYDRHASSALPVLRKLKKQGFPIQTIAMVEDAAAFPAIGVTSGIEIGNEGPVIVRVVEWTAHGSEWLAAIDDAQRVTQRFDQGESSETSLVVQPLKILLVEDGVANQILATELLKKWNHQVSLAQNGVEAIMLYRDNEFDLILMDVQMPIMDGITATREIRQIEKERGIKNPIPIIAMTAHAMAGDRERCLSAGMDGYLSKPVRQGKLYETIASSVASRLEREPAPPSPSSCETKTTSADSAQAAEGVAVHAPATPAERRENTPLASHSADPPGESKPVVCAIDWDAARETVAGDERILANIGFAALKEIDQILVEIPRAAAAQQPETVRRLVHTFHGTLRIFSEPTVIRLVSQMEDECRMMKLDDAMLIYRELEPRMRAVQAAIREYVEQPPKSV